MLYPQITDWEEERRLQQKYFRTCFSALKSMIYGKDENEFYSYTIAKCASVYYAKKKNNPNTKLRPLESIYFYSQTFSFCFQIWFKTWSLLSEALDDLGVEVSL